MFYELLTAIKNLKFRTSIKTFFLSVKVKQFECNRKTNTEVKTVRNYLSVCLIGGKAFPIVAIYVGAGKLSVVERSLWKRLGVAWKHPGGSCKLWSSLVTLTPTLSPNLL